ncbi:NADH-quinone oxidoreductase subunit NuoF [Lentimicrobium sp.]|jgi:NADH-quinone oxidoreductase subunit F|uniref:NADH-quinone oxidoreductase subunit NuoF n=1 Tax=Lentimicrobium sp. TaxID=2034841 RepID=UPI0025F4FF11|nr:NADH-quinone oxidoreductase subunit NuoF [Lentimicrobium sp.]HOP12759.1 NADH-quinone oxidoreductase subunit NuoF [Lentimicrobium sp.]HPF63428.1 NADH-quinone oxidoreductase subunit NuoF [Lentimicrobium sp.]HPR25730.1 NADH-quinone oxidoreductase subunit NuoF [Lentimicrobium sp.]HRW68890.1 NADH-quinone oxidoreductase subunit NuoF [Lentimicrobium sp.]
MSKTQVIVGLGSCGIAAGAGKTYNKIKALKEAENLDFELKKTSCVGMCYREPLVEIVDSTGTYLYGEIDEDRVFEIIDKHIVQGSPVKEYVVQSDLFKTPENEFLDEQVKIVLRNCGHMDPESIEEYQARQGYAAIRKIAGEQISGADVIQKVLDSGIRGRGGGGFPTGMKWRFAAGNPSDEKFIICNADEGDPGAFMDRSVLEGDPHSVLEGMIIGAYAIGATEGVIYCRAEYPLAIKRLNIALDQAREHGYLGKNILGIKGFNFDIHIKEGAGAFVCGEETALIASVEGERGMPRKRPPFPAASGLWRKPTNINNVETYANIPWIILNGPEAYAKYGTEKSKGTKVFALAGKIRRSGLVEVPMGITIRDVIFKLGGGIKDNKKFKAVQMGGPSGGCIPEYLADTIVDYDSVNATGAIMGSGGMVVMDETTCMIDVAKFFLDFTQKESCGKCTFCRIGTKRMLEILNRITEGEGRDGDIELLEELAYQIKDTSLCGLGQTAPNPVLTTIRYFRDEYEAHIYHKKCPAKVCKKLLTYEVDPEKCTGCTVCAKNCPTHAIDGDRKQIHFIRQDACIRCGECYSRCKFDAIKIF